MREGPLAKIRTGDTARDSSIFVCYSHADEAVVYSDIQWLESQGIEVWYDRGISGGTVWRAEVAEALERSGLMAFYISQDSVASEHCNREVNYALDQGKTVVPIYLGAAELSPDLRIGLNRVQALNRYEVPAETYQAQLANAVGIQDAPVPQSTPPSRRRGPLLAVFMLLAAVLLAGYFVRTSMTLAPLATSTELPETATLRNSVAVLPFENLSPDEQDAYFAAGIHEEVLNQLAKVKDLSVIARTSVMGYAETTKSIPVIAAELNVETVMEGSVRYAGNRVRITAQLIDAETGTHVWSDSYDRDLIDVFAIQSDIARHITLALKAEFSVSERASIGARTTESVEAYAEYVRAMSYLHDLGSPDRVHAGLDAAIAIDPEFAQAIAAKAYMHGFQIGVPFVGSVITPDSSRRDAELAIEYANRALLLDQDQAGAYLALALVANYEFRWQDSFENAKLALALNPNGYINLVFLAEALIDRGRVAEGIELHERAIALDPQNWTLRWFFSNFLMNAERWDYAQDQARQVMAMQPDRAEGFGILAACAAIVGDQNTALEAAREVEVRDPNLEELTSLVWVYGAIGLSDDAHRVNGVIHRLTGGIRQNPRLAYFTNIALGDLDAAADSLYEAIDRRYPEGFARFVYFHSDHPMLDPVRHLSRFDDALRKLGVDNGG